MYSNKILIKLRGILVKLGLTKLIKLVYNPASYEENFNEALLNCIHEGDCVYDIGANVGLYTDIFAKKVGIQGYVYAFEPDKLNYSQLMESKEQWTNVELHNVGLGAENKMMKFFSDGVTSRIIENPDYATFIEVPIHRLEDFVTTHNTRKPNVLKIDVEGFEIEVIDGAGELLKDPALKSICMEVHFKAIRERGKSAELERMIRLLKKNNFKLKWSDPSHVIATRN